MQSAAHFRHHMIDGQLEPNRVLSGNIIAAMGVVERESFVPQAYSGAAYLDDMIPLGAGRFMLPPLVTGQMLQALDPQAGQRVLVMGDGSGYTAALLSQMGCKTHLLEVSQELAGRARLTLSKNTTASVEVHTGAFEMGLGAHKPYDHILFCGAASNLPECWQKQLSQAAGSKLCYIAVRSAINGTGFVRGQIVTASQGAAGWIETGYDDVTAPLALQETRAEGFRFD